MNAKSFARKALITTVLAGSLAGVGANVANAKTSDASLSGSVDGPYKTSCNYSAHVKWVRASDTIDADDSWAYIKNNEWFSACRKNLVVNFVGAEGWKVQRTVELPTGAAVTDPTAPSQHKLPIELVGAVGPLAPFIDHIEVGVVDR